MKKIVPLGLCILLLSCSGEYQSNEQVMMQSVDTTAAKQPEISDEVIGAILNSIPSPLELSNIIKESGGAYNVGYLNNHANSSKYNSSFKKAVNLGIYGTDLGYINIYNQSKDGLMYIQSIKGLADELSIGHFFDLATIKRLASNSDNIDSLLRITTTNFEKINHFLQEKKRSEQSILILTGGWIEALHISCQVAKLNPNETLMEKIGEQKIILDQLLLLISNYQSDPQMQQLAEELKKLKEVYNTVEITYTYKESTMKEVNGVLVISDESESKIHLNQDQLSQITEITENIRKSLIS
ncbi:MAG TPA: hypothetical protein VIK89_06800 [Cytophagaceae bacterium]